jgi:hypothetical protein
MAQARARAGKLGGVSARTLSIGFLVALTIACGSPTSPSVPAGAIRVAGTVQFYTIEGGFWAIKGDDGVTYDPKDGLPAEFQVQNRRVTMVAKVRSDLGGVHGVGPIVEIISIE